MKTGDRVRARKDGRLLDGVIQWIVYAGATAMLEIVLENRCVVQVASTDLVPVVPIGHDTTLDRRLC